MAVAIRHDYLEAAIMHFKLIVAFTEEAQTDAVMEAARKAGATGATLVSQARGEGVEVNKTFFGLSLEAQMDMLLFLVEEHLARNILETIEKVGGMEAKGGGIAFQIDVEDAVGVSHQVRVLMPRVEEEL
jgi:nitrogen regulatory protein PII